MAAKSVRAVTDALALVPTWCLQDVLLLLFASAYHYRTLQRWVAAPEA